MNREVRHVGIILDGNRRYAKKNTWKPWKGHGKGAENVRNLLSWAKELDIKEITLYSLAIKNLQRSKEEVDELMNLFRKHFSDPKFLKKANEENVRINFAGKLSLLPDDVQEICNELSEKTKNNTKYIANFAIAYDGREEILSGVKKICEKVKKGEMQIGDISEKTFSENLYINSEPDFIIRTGGDNRASNFLTWQGSYTEWFFLDVLWPEFTKKHLVDCIDMYKKRERRFGK